MVPAYAHMSYKRIIHKFFRIYMESFIVILFISYNKPSITFSKEEVIKNSVIMSVIIFSIRMYNRDLYDKARSGMFYSLGSCLL